LEVALDPDFAGELSVPNSERCKVPFAGGQHAEVQNGRIESLTVGDWTVKNLPIATLAVRQLSEGFDVKRIDGIIGTNLLYHFLATLDYPHGEFVLRRKSGTRQTTRPPGGASRLPGMKPPRACHGGEHQRSMRRARPRLANGLFAPRD
jgi:Aspartyl protease